MSMIVQWNAATPAQFEQLSDLDEDGFVEWLESAGALRSFDLDKAWHAVHYVLTGTAWDTGGPLGATVLGGVDFGHDLGYGPPRWITPEQVAQSSAALSTLTDAELRRRLDFAVMDELDIYPAIWDRDPVEEQLVEFVLDAVTTLRSRFATAADEGHGFVISMI